MTLKVKILNFFRNIFKIPLLEKWVVTKTTGKYTSDIISKLIPNSDQYKQSTFRYITRYGIKLKVDISDYVGHYLYYGFEDPPTKKLFSLCHKDYNVIDVGTNIGLTLIKFSSLSESGTVIGFEPDSYNRASCLENIKLNESSNATVLPYGLGETEDIFKMEIVAEHNRGCNRITSDLSGNTFDVEIKRMDDVDQIKKMQKIDLIKIDVEGYELKVLKGAKNTLQSHKPTLFIEVDDNYLKKQGDSVKNVIVFLEQTGYKKILRADDNSPVTVKDDFSNCHYDIVASFTN